MNIKEVEQATGMSRANIRFYESEGLISPQRNENGYRNYSEADLAELYKIKLMRILDISIEEIKKLENGGIELQEALKMAEKRLSGEMEKLQKSKQICGEMIKEESSYEALNAEAYLMEARGNTYFKIDETDKENASWQRYLARTVDSSFYAGIILYAFISIGKLDELFESHISPTVVSMFILLVMESLMLAIFGYAPGKWLFRVRVMHPTGEKLTFKESFKRTWLLILKGLGLGIPIYEWYTLYKSYNTFSAGELLPWEEKTQSCTEIGKLSKWRGAFLVLVVVILEVFIPVVLMALPDNILDYILR